MSIHFKFKSAKEFDTVTFAGTVIRVLDLKKAIIEKKKLNKGLDFDLVITDAQNGKVYDDENMQLPRNTSVTVKRIPSQQPGSGLLARMKAEAAAAAAAAPAPVPVAQHSPVVMPMGVPMPVPSAPLNAAMANASLNPSMSDEPAGAQTMEDELAALQSIHEQAEDMRGARPLGNKTWTASGGSNADRVTNYYSGGRGGGPGGGGGRGFNSHMGGGRGPMGGRGQGGDFGGGRGRGGGGGPMGLPGMHNNPNQVMGAPPPNYVCYRCGTPGHYIQNCPTNGDPEYDQHRVKKKTGIPKSFMKAVSDPSEIPVGVGKTVVNAPWGGLAVIEPQNKNFSKLMAKSGGSATLDQFIANPPDHLACPLCKRLMNDAVLIPCCQESACDECLRGALIERKLTCPLCNTTNMSPEKLLPNKVLRTSVDEFLRRARTEQQEREQLVKNAEEKAMAKQKADQMAVSTAGRRSGESADATLEIKKGKKEEEEEEDEFGGDIFGSGDENDDSNQTSAAQASPPQAAPGGLPNEPPLPPLPKEEGSSAHEPGPSRKLSDVSMNGGAGEGQQLTDGQGSGKDSEAERLHQQHLQQLPAHMQGPPGHPMPWQMGPPGGPGMGFPPQDPWFNGPPRAPGPWFDGPPPPWFDGPGFPGPGGPRGMKGGRGGRGAGIPPPGYFGPPPGHPDYFGPPPGHPDYFGPPPPWFDGPMPPFGGRGGGSGGGGRGAGGGGRGGMWFEGDRGLPPRGRDDDQRRHRADSRDLGKDGARGDDRGSRGDGRRDGDSKGASGDKSSSNRERDRRSRSRSRGGGGGGSSSRARKSQHGRSRSRSRSRKQDRDPARDSSRARRSRSTSRDHRKDRKSGSRPSSPQKSERDNRGSSRAPSSSSGVQSEREKKRVDEPKSTVEDVKLDQVAAPAIDLDFLQEHDDVSESENEQKHSVGATGSSPGRSAAGEDSESRRKDGGGRSGDSSYAQKALSSWKNDASGSSRKRSTSPSGRRNRSAERERPAARSTRSRSRSASRRRSSNDSSRRKGETSSSSGAKRSGDRSSSTKEQDRGERPRDKERERGRDRDDERDRNRGRGGRDRDSSKRSRDEDDSAGDARGDKRKRRSPEKEQTREGKRGGEKGNGSGRVVTTSSRGSRGSGASAAGAAASGGQSGSRGGSSRNQREADKRRIEYDDDMGERKKGGGGGGSSSRKPRGDDSRGSKSFGDNQTKKRSVLDRLGPAL